MACSSTLSTWIDISNEQKPQVRRSYLKLKRGRRGDDTGRKTLKDIGGSFLKRIADKVRLTKRSAQVHCTGDQTLLVRRQKCVTSRFD